MIQNPHSPSSWELLWGQFGTHCFSFDSFSLKPPGTGTDACCTVCLNPATPLQPQHLERLRQPLPPKQVLLLLPNQLGKRYWQRSGIRMCARAFELFFFPPLVGSSLCQHRHFEMTDKNMQKFEGESGNKVTAKKKKKKKKKTATSQRPAKMQVFGNTGE